MAGLLFIGVLHTLFFTVRGFFKVFKYDGELSIFCGFLVRTYLFFFARFILETFGDMFAEIEEYCLKLMVFFKWGGTIGFEMRFFRFTELEATLPRLSYEPILNLMELPLDAGLT